MATPQPSCLLWLVLLLELSVLQCLGGRVNIKINDGEIRTNTWNPPASNWAWSKPTLSRQPHKFAGHSSWEELGEECFKKVDNQYQWELCPYQNATQRDKSLAYGSLYVILGVWDKWKVKDGKYESMMFTDGTSCANGKHRSVQVNIKCGTKDKTELTDIQEPVACEYHFTLESKKFCGTKLNAPPPSAASGSSSSSSSSFSSAAAGSSAASASSSSGGSSGSGSASASSAASSKSVSAGSSSSSASVSGAGGVASASNTEAHSASGTSTDAVQTCSLQEHTIMEMQECINALVSTVSSLSGGGASTSQPNLSVCKSFVRRDRATYTQGGRQAAPSGQDSPAQGGGQASRITLSSEPTPSRILKRTLRPASPTKAPEAASIDKAASVEAEDAEEEDEEEAEEDGQNGVVVPNGQAQQQGSSDTVLLENEGTADEGGAEDEDDADAEEEESDSADEVGASATPVKGQTHDET